jgi:hypothetical protein
MANVTDLLRSNQLHNFDPVGMHFACFQEDTEELLHAIRSNESVIGFWFDPFLPPSDEDDALRQDYLNWCSQLLDACSQLRGLRRAYMNTSHFPLSMKQLCQFVQQTRQLEHFSLGSLSRLDNYGSSDGTYWLGSPLSPLLHHLREHSHLLCFDLHLPDQKSDTCRGLLEQLYSLSNLRELRVSFCRACPSDPYQYQSSCWMSSTLQKMPRLQRLTLRNVVHDQSNSFLLALQENLKLQELRLVDNHMDELGWNALAQSLRTSCHLQILRISHGNCLLDRFLRLLAQALNDNQNTALQELHFAGNQSEEGCVAQTNALLLNLLSTNTSLQRIEIEGHESNEVIELYLKLNRAGRSKWRSDFEACWDCMVHQDLDCIYIMLQENPILCRHC